MRNTLFDAFYSRLPSNNPHRECDNKRRSEVICTLEFVNITNVSACVL